MTDDTTSRFTGDVPAGYHEYLGPILFEPYADLVADRVAALGPRRILETAAGTGIVTSRIANRHVAWERFVATDLNAAMLDVARAGAPATVEFEAADMCALPFPDGAFDCVVCQFGLMFPPDRAAAAGEARRVLEPGGTWLALTWGPMSSNPIIDVTHRALIDAFPDDPPLFYATPYSIDDPGELAALLRGAGFGGVTVETVAATGRSPSARLAARGLIHGNPVAEHVRARDPERLPEVEAAVETAIAARLGSGPLEVPLVALIATATA